MQYTPHPRSGTLGAASEAQWFYIQQISAAVSGGTVSQNVGPFYGDPMAMLPLTGSRDNILIYVNGAWSELRGLPGGGV